MRVVTFLPALVVGMAAAIIAQEFHIGTPAVHVAIGFGCFIMVFEALDRFIPKKAKKRKYGR